MFNEKGESQKDLMCLWYSTFPWWRNCCVMRHNATISEDVVMCTCCIFYLVSHMWCRQYKHLEFKQFGSETCQRWPECFSIPHLQGNLIYSEALTVSLQIKISYRADVTTFVKTLQLKFFKWVQSAKWFTHLCQLTLSPELPDQIFTILIHFYCFLFPIEDTQFSRKFNYWQLFGSTTGIL